MTSPSLNFELGFADPEISRLRPLAMLSNWLELFVPKNR